jgi:uncharacterized protein YutE (UPF0331/DUF86 family)
MISDERLEQVADPYRLRGYAVTVRPSASELPPFAKDFKIEILATRGDGNVLVSVRKNPTEFRKDPDVSRYAEAIDHQKGWRYDIIVLEADNRPESEVPGAKEPSESDIRKALNDAERMQQAGFVAQSLIAAWSALESAMRWRIRAEGLRDDWKTSPKTMINELYSHGFLSRSTFDDLEGYLRLRNVIVHGFAPPEVEPSAVEFLVRTARELLDEPVLAKQSA